MDDQEARLLAQGVLVEGETLLWAEAAPIFPGLLIYLLLVIVLSAIVVGSFWLTLRFWRLLLRSLPSFTKQIHKIASIGSLVIATLIVTAIVAVAGNVMNVFTAGSTVYAITDQRAMIVNGIGGAPIAHDLDLAKMRVVRQGDTLSIGQFMSFELFGHVLDPAFRDLEDAAAVETMLRRLARVAALSEVPEELRERIMLGDAQTAEAIAPALYLTETVLWSQHAEGRPYAFNSAVIVLFMGFFGLGLFFGSASPKLNPQWPLEWRCLMGAIGAAMSLWALASAGWLIGGGQVYYALTDQRVIVARTAPWFAVHEYGHWYFDDEDDVRVTGSTIRFCDRSSGRRSDCGNKYLSGVQNADAVAALIRDAMSRHSAASEALH